MSTRQVKRNEERKQSKQINSDRKLLNEPVFKRDLARVYEIINQIGERNFHLELLFGALERVLIDQGSITKSEFEKAYDIEMKRAEAYKLVNNSDGNYEERINTCIVNEFKIEQTIIPQQLIYDKEVSDDFKRELAEKYNIETLKEYFKSKDGIETK